jgi:hypothetical protein
MPPASPTRPAVVILPHRHAGAVQARGAEVANGEEVQAEDPPYT